jgi:hypothetical protein
VTNNQETPKAGSSPRRQDTDMPDWWQRWARAIRAHHQRDPKANSYNAIGRRAGDLMPEKAKRDATVSEILKKRTMPHVDTFLSVCAAIDVSPAAILLGLDWTETEEHFVQELAKLPPEKRERVFGYLAAVAEEGSPPPASQKPVRH